MEKNRFQKTFTQLASYFFRGLVVVIPILVTIYLFYTTITWVDSLIGIKIPGIGFLFSLIGITLIGFFGSGLITKPLFDIFDTLMDKTPGVKFIYSSVKDMLEAFVGDKKKFTEPVLVEMTENGILKMGFVTKKDLSELEAQKDLTNYVAVYFPHSYNFSGNLYFCPIDKVIKVDGKNSDLMKMIVTGGITTSNQKDGKIKD
jgi:uncharacterized membrane protein